MFKHSTISVLILFIMSVGSLRAEAFSPVGVSVFTFTDHMYLEFPTPESDVYGVRLNLLSSRHQNVGGVDIGLIMNTTKANFTGIEFAGIVNRVYGRARILGLQFGGLYNLDYQASILGLQLAAFKNHIVEDGTLIGAQLSIGINEAPKTDIYGLQFALFNRARKVYGFQIGVVNIAENLNGIQIGLLNFNKNGLPLKFFPGINIGF